MWQIPNDTLHADKIMTDYNSQRRSLHIQTAIWYDKENEFEQDDRKYFDRPYLERLTDPNHLLQAWCVTMERLHTMNEYRRETTLGRDIRCFCSLHTKQIATVRRGLLSTLTKVGRGGMVWNPTVSH